MFGMRALALTIGLVAPATGQATSGGFDDPVAIFASCAGRFSAQMEHSWLIGDDPADVTRHRAAMVDLVEAAMPPGRGSEVLARRIEAKFAQAALLQRASFSTDATEARLARTAARAALDQCLFLIVS